MVATRVVSTSSDDMLSEQESLDFQNGLLESIEAIQEGNQERFAKSFPDSRLRARAVSSLRSTIPPAGSGYQLGIKVGSGREIPVRSDALKKIDVDIPKSETQPVRETITGRLTGISFEDRKLTITYAPTSRDLECLYHEDLEPMLFENRRDLIQVTGKVKRNEVGEPNKIVDVESIEELDLSPMFLSVVPLGDGRTVRLKERLQLPIVLSESEQLLSIEYEPLQVDVFAATRDQLWEELLEQVAMLWVEYAEADEEELSPPARELRRRLLAIGEVVLDGP